jgi:adenylate kinase family enzyme
VRERLKVYEQETKPLVEYYSSRPTFHVVDGTQPPERVAEEIAAKCDPAGSEAHLRQNR